VVLIVKRLTMRAADGGYAPRFQAFSWLWAVPVSTARPPSHPPQLTQAVRRTEALLGFGSSRKIEL
jgi:hypothetical protein